MKHTQKIRARYVATELNTQDDTACSAATPPLEAIRPLLSKYAQRVPAKPKLKLSALDVTKAYVHATPSRKMFVRAPKELGLAAGTVGRLKTYCYGTRDAGALWEECYATALVEVGCRRGVACPTCVVHEEKQLSIAVHGDDFVGLSEEDALKRCEEEMSKRFEIGDRCRLGMGMHDSRKTRILNRTVRLTDAGLRFEADPRHSELLTGSLGLENCNGVSTTGVNPTMLTWRPRRSGKSNPPCQRRMPTRKMQNKQSDIRYDCLGSSHTPLQQMLRHISQYLCALWAHWASTNGASVIGHGRLHRKEQEHHAPACFCRARA